MRDGPAEVLDPHELRAMIDAEGADALIVGDWQSLPDSLFAGSHNAKMGRPRFPAADVLLEVARLRAANEDYAEPEQVRPLYMREPDAAINWTAFREEGMWPGASS